MSGGGWTGKDLHVGREGVEGFVEVVHLHEDTEHNDDAEYVSAWVGELVFTAEGEFDCDTEAFDGHDGDGADERADGDVDDGIGATVTGDDTVYHDEGEYKDCETVHQETCDCEDVELESGDMRADVVHLVGGRNAGFHRRFRQVCLPGHVGR